MRCLADFPKLGFYKVGIKAGIQWVNLTNIIIPIMNFPCFLCKLHARIIMSLIKQKYAIWFLFSALLTERQLMKSGQALKTLQPLNKWRTQSKMFLLLVSWIIKRLQKDLILHLLRFYLHFMKYLNVIHQNKSERKKSVNTTL